MKNRIINKIRGFVLSLLIVVLPIYLIGYFGQKEIENNKKYTIGYATGKGWSGGSILNFEWSVNNKIYYGGSGFNQDYNKFIGKRYFVKFSSIDFGNARILINMPVPDSIKEAPPVGWSPEEFEKLFGGEK